MYRDQLLETLKPLQLPMGEYCLFGGSCLAIRDIRPTDDVDMYVTSGLYQKLKNENWRELQGAGYTAYLITEINGVEFEAFTTSDSEGWKPDIPKYLAQPEVIEGYPFMPLDDLYEWKANVRRPKDIRDIKLINEFYEKNKSI